MATRYEPGIKRLSNREYHDAAGISSTDLKMVFFNTPAHWWYSKEHPVEAKPAWNLGTAVHTLVIEPDLTDSTVAVAPKVDRRTKAGKLDWQAFELASVGKTIVTAEQWDDARRMADSVLTHPVAREAFTGGVGEASVFAKRQGVMVKARPDYWSGALLTDLKTTRSASPDAFQRQAASLGYHIQAAHYLRVCSEFGDATSFLFVAVESAPPYAVACYQPDEQTIRIGAEHAREAFRRLVECMKSGVYPGYSQEIKSLSLPGWMIARHEYDTNTWN